MESQHLTGLLQIFGFRRGSLQHLIVQLPCQEQPHLEVELLGICIVSAESEEVTFSRLIHSRDRKST